LNNIFTLVSGDAYTITSYELCQYLYLATQMAKGMVIITMVLLQCSNG